MKKIYSVITHNFLCTFIFLSLMVVGASLNSTAQTTYTWNIAGSGSIATAANWTPARNSPANNDILNINNGGTKTIDIPSGFTAGQINISGNTNVTFQKTGATAATITLASALSVANGSTLTLTGATGGANLNLAFSGTSTNTIAGTLNLNQGSATLTSGINTANSTTTVTGFINRNGLNTTITSTAATLIFGNGGTYVHNINGGTIPTATWNIGSTASVTGITNTFPTAGATQNFYNLNIQSTLTAAAAINTDLTVLGTLTINNASAFELSLVNSTTGRTISAGNFSLIGGLFTLKNTSNGSATLSVTGNLVISGGTFTYRTGGSGSAPVVNVSGNFNLSGGTLNMQTNNQTGILNLSGNYTHSGGTLTELDNGAGEFLFTGNKQHIFSSVASASNNINYIVETGDTLQFDLPTTLITGAGAFTAQAGSTTGIRHPQGISTTASTGQVQTTGAKTYSTSANYIYNGSAAQATGNGVTGAANLTIANTGASTVTMTNNNVAVTGNVLISSGTLALGSNIMTVGGNWTNNAAFTSNGAAPNGKVTFNGSGIQTIGGSTITTFNHSDLNKTTGTVVLAQDINISGTLNIGVNLDLTTHILTMSAASPAIGTLGTGSFSATKMIIANGGGEVRKLLTSAAAVAFPIGDTTGTAEYTPALVSFSGGIYAGYVSAKVVDAKHPANGNITNYLTRYWTISQSGFSGFSATVGLTYDDADIVGDENNIRMGKWDGNEPWVRFDPSSVPALNSIYATVTSFSDFTGINLLEALPVKLTSFNATLMDKAALLEWTTAEEVNSSHYDVEYSTDGQHFISLSRVNSRNSMTGSFYSYKHLNPINGKNYYRLKMIDIDDKFDYSPIIMLKYSGEQRHLNAYPNPASDNVTIQFEKAGKGAFIRVVDMQGKLVQSIQVPAGATLQQIRLNNLNRGMYNIIYENGGEKTIHRIQKN
ncbi:T9SS type A sorting domain-containing protein [Pollutibacter soli]|uniref:T9SS type A sorting domain-containing protein n=1 Tax=Pollutibacter soli TaxID=3034157 RepID=UPI003013EC1E